MTNAIKSKKELTDVVAVLITCIHIIKNQYTKSVYLPATTVTALVKVPIFTLKNLKFF